MSSYSSYNRRGAGYTVSSRNYRSDRDPTAPTLPPDRNITDGLESTPIKTLSKPVVDISKGAPVRPTNVKYIGSYNWVDDPHPTIIVPGSPPEWSDRPFPYTVPFDRGVRMVDQNGFRMGTAASCLLPLFRAVDIVSEENADTSIDWSTVDFITDRNGLRKLMRWINYSAGSGEPLKEFRIDLQLGGKKTVLMHRWEKRTREMAEPPRSGCGINFERQSTVPAKGCERGTGHHRIVQYDFGGLKMVVRFEVDACIPQPVTATRLSSTRSGGARANTTASANVDDLNDLLAGLNVSSQPSLGSSSGPVTQSSDITVIRAGSQVPQSSIVELTTRSVKYIDQFDWAEQYPQLLLSYTPHLFLAAHDRGVFQRMKKHKLGTTELSTVESNGRIQRSFRQLEAILRVIQSLAKENGHRRRLSLVCRDGRLEVLERVQGQRRQGSLPDSELERFGV